jgi:hypothetical protein
MLLLLPLARPQGSHSKNRHGKTICKALGNKQTLSKHPESWFELHTLQDSARELVNPDMCVRCACSQTSDVTNCESKSGSDTNGQAIRQRQLFCSDTRDNCYQTFMTAYYTHAHPTFVEWSCTSKAYLRRLSLQNTETGFAHIQCCGCKLDSKSKTDTN